MDKIFLHFTIKGDDLNISNLIRDIPINAKVFEKGKVYAHKFVKSPKVQKTNRWVYSLESFESEKINQLINRLFKDLYQYKTQVIGYTQKYRSTLDIVIYADGIVSKYNVGLTKRSINIISNLNSKLNVTVVDF